MKKILLFITASLVMIACKKQPKMITEPEPEVIQTSKSFSVKITFTSDSLCDTSAPIPGYYASNNMFKHSISLNIDTVPNSTQGIKNASMYLSGVGPTYTLILQTTNGLPVTITSNDLNKPFIYYINVKESLYDSNGILKIYKYSKLHTFSEGDNGIINFNNLP